MFSYLSSRRPGRLILLATFALAIPGYAQNITGSMTGRVTDQQGASIPNAIVTVTEPAKHVTAAQKTTAGGDFSVAGLLPGDYSVTVEATGFKKLSRTGITLNANDKLSVGDLVLEVGAVTDSIEVSRPPCSCKPKAWSAPPPSAASRLKTSKSTAEMPWTWPN